MSKPVKDRPNWEELAEAYANGESDVEIAKRLNITISHFMQLYEENPAFATFVDRGRTLAQAWWYEQGRTNLWNKAFNTSLWVFQLKNKYGWADKIDTNDTTDKDPVNLDQVRGQLHAALKQVTKKHPELLSGVNLNLPKEH